VLSFVLTRKQTKNLFEDAKYYDLVGNDIDSYYNSNGYMSSYLKTPKPPKISRISYV